MRSLWLLGSFFWWISVHASPAKTGTVVLSRTIGSVNDVTFTSREASLSGLLDRLLAEEKEVSSPRSVDSADGHREQSTLLLEEAISREAGAFGVATVPDNEVTALVQRAEKALGGRAEWRKLAYSTAEIRAMAERKLNAKRLIKIKTEAMRGVISDSEAQSYFEKNRVKFGTLPFDSFKENIKTFLGQQQLEERLRAWFEIMRRKYKVREDRGTDPTHG